MGKYKVIQVGCGKMSTYTMKYALDKGYEIVGALDISSELIGKDIEILKKLPTFSPILLVMF